MASNAQRMYFSFGMGLLSFFLAKAQEGNIAMALYLVAGILIGYSWYVSWETWIDERVELKLEKFKSKRIRVK